MRKNRNKIVCIKLVHLPYLYIWCTVTLISNDCCYFKFICWHMGLVPLLCNFFTYP